MSLMSFLRQMFQKNEPEPTEENQKTVDEFIISSSGKISTVEINSIQCKKHSKICTINCPQFKQAFDRDKGTFNCVNMDGNFKFKWITDDRAVGNNLTGHCD